MLEEVRVVWEKLEKGVGNCVGVRERRDVGRGVEVWGCGGDSGVWGNVERSVGKYVGVWGRRNVEKGEGGVLGCVGR